MFCNQSVTDCATAVNIHCTSQQKATTIPISYMSSLQATVTQIQQIKVCHSYMCGGENTLLVHVFFRVTGGVKCTQNVSFPLSPSKHLDSHSHLPESLHHCQFHHQSLNQFLNLRPQNHQDTEQSLLNHPHGSVKRNEEVSSG